MLRVNKNAANIQAQLYDENKVKLNYSPNEPVPPKLGQLQLRNGQSAKEELVKELLTKEQPAKEQLTKLQPIKLLTVKEQQPLKEQRIREPSIREPSIREQLKLPLSRIPRFGRSIVEEIEDIDKSTSRDAIYLVSDLAKDIYSYMYELEEIQGIQEDHLKSQQILTPKIRQRLINWCIEVHNALELLPETLYTTIAILDRFFERFTVKQQNQVMLVAISATLIASKYEEIYVPTVGDLIEYSQKLYSKSEVLRMEIRILEMLEFNLGKPIPLAFLRRFSKAAHCDLKMHSIAKYLMELSLTEYECSHWRPSKLAAAALFTTIHLVNQDSSSKDRWTKSLVHYTRYSRKDMLKPSGILCSILKRSQKSPASFYCVKKNQHSFFQWPELRSARVDELIKLSQVQSLSNDFHSNNRSSGN